VRFNDKVFVAKFTVCGLDISCALVYSSRSLDVCASLCLRYWAVAYVFVTCFLVQTFTVCGGRDFGCAFLFSFDLRMFVLH